MAGSIEPLRAAQGARPRAQPGRRRRAHAPRPGVPAGQQGRLVLHARPKLGSPGRRKRRLSALSRAACATCGATHLSGAFAERVALARARARGWRSPKWRAKSLYAYLPAARRSGTASPGSCCGPRRRSRHGARRQEHTLGAANPTHGQSLGAPAREGRRGAAARGRQRAPRTAPRCTAARRVARDSCPIWQRVAAGAAAVAHVQGREAARGHVSDIAQRHAGANARAAPRTRGWGWGERPPSCNDSRNDPTTSFFCW